MTDHHVRPARPDEFGAVGVLTAASLVLLAAGMQRTPAFPAALITSVEPVAAALLSIVFLGDAMTPLQVAGGVAIVGGVVGVSAGGTGVR